MASVQYYRTYEESRHVQKNQQHGSLGEKVSELFNGHHHPDNLDSTYQQGHGSRRKEHKKNLFQKIKDGLSGHSSDSNSSSDDSDNENHHNRKN